MTAYFPIFPHFHFVIEENLWSYLQVVVYLCFVSRSYGLLMDVLCTCWLIKYDSNENIFNNTGLGWQPKCSWIHPRNDRGRVGRDMQVMLCPAAGSGVGRNVRSKESVPLTGFREVTPTRGYLARCCTCDGKSPLCASLKEPDFCPFVLNSNKWQC